MVILSGGDSKRYKQKGRLIDKALMEVNAKPLLFKIVEDGLNNYDNVIVSLNNNKRKKKYERVLKPLLKEDNVDFVEDDKEISFIGVGKGIASVLSKLLMKTSIQFIPCDRPYLDVKLLRQLETVNEGVTILNYQNGLIEPLLALYDENYTFPPSFVFSLNLSRADVFIRLAPRIRLYDVTEIIKVNNLESSFFANVNTPMVDAYNLSLEKEKYLLPKSKIVERKKIEHLDVIDLIDNPDDRIHHLIEREHFYLAFLVTKYLFRNQVFDFNLFSYYVNIALKSEYEYWMEKNIPFLGLHALQDLSHSFKNNVSNEIDIEIKTLKEKIGIKKK